MNRACDPGPILASIRSATSRTASGPRASTSTRIICAVLVRSRSSRNICSATSVTVVARSIRISRDT